MYDSDQDKVECPGCGEERYPGSACHSCGSPPFLTAKDVGVRVDDEPTIELSPDQNSAMWKVVEWFRGGGGQPLTLGGYAGTGKTTIIKQIIREIGGTIAVAAFTGKAAHVLQRKGIKGARTLHSLIYQPETRCRECGAPMYSTTKCEITKHCPAAGVEVHFVSAPILEADLVIIDEASMVSRDLHEDLQAYGVPTLYVGDHGQLEPIGANPRLMLDPQIRLDQIHRQAEGSPIIRFAHHVRQHLDPETMGDQARVLHSGIAPKDAHTYDIVLVGRNSTRVAMNRMIRRRLGFVSPLPEINDRVICLRNDKDKGLFNGMLATVKGVRMDDTVDDPEIDIVDDDGVPRNGLVFEPEQFGSEDLLDNTSRKRQLFDFGYALTVHKAQGSEWKRVLVLEWIHPKTSAARWRYTAATRAVDELVWCMQAPRKRRPQ